MKKALVVYDSVFGNTRQVAEAVAKALQPGFSVQVVQVQHLQPEALTGLDLLVVGSPTRGFRPTEDVQKWLDSLPAGSLKGVRAAVFDTRIPYETIKSPILHVAVKLFAKGDGYAASTMGAALEAKGAALIADPLGFVVQDREGPLAAGELERAAAWGGSLMEKH